jgi:hypothetical protein
MCGRVSLALPCPARRVAYAQAHLRAGVSAHPESALFGVVCSSLYIWNIRDKTLPSQPDIVLVPMITTSYADPRTATFFP